MYVLNFTCLSHLLDINGTSEGHWFKQKHHSSQVVDHNLWTCHISLTEKLWPQKHSGAPGFRPHGRLSSLFVWFVQSAPLRTCQGMPPLQVPEVPGGLWGNSEQGESLVSTSKTERCWAGLERDPHPSPRSLDKRKEISLGIWGPSSACCNPESCRGIYTNPGTEGQPGRAEEEEGNLPYIHIYSFSVFSYYFEFSLSWRVSYSAS